MTEVEIPVRPVANPLHPEDRDLLERLHERAKAHTDVIQRAKAAGLNVDEHAARNQMHLDVSKALREQFFPVLMSPDDGPTE